MSRRREGVPWRTNVGSWLKRWRSGAIRLAERKLARANMSDVISDVSSLMSLDYVRDQVVDIKVVDAPRVISIATPGVHGDLQRDFIRGEVMTMRLTNVIVEPTSGLILMNGGFVLAPHTSHWIDFLSRGGYAHELHLLHRSSRAIGGKWTIAPAVRHFWHFATEHLPSLIRTAQAGVDSIMVPSRQPSWYYDFIGELYSNVRQLERGAYRVQELVVTTSHSPASSTDVALVRDFFVPDLPSPTGRAVYVSRMMSLRRPAGESRRCEALSEAGLDVVNVENLGVREQIRFFASASAICGYAGSGFANMLWMKPGSQALALYETQVRNDFTVPLLAEACELSFTASLGDSPEEDMSTVCSWKASL